MQGEFRVGEWLVRPSLNQIEGRGEQCTVEPKAMDVLVYLAQEAGEVLPKEQIIRAVWPDLFVTDEVLTNCIFQLRRAFEDDAKRPSYIQTVPRRGYRLIAEVVEGQTPEEASPYRILKKIGEGGMGEVFLAEDKRLGRRVALKFLSEELQEDRTALRRFDREAKAAAAVDHPFLCKIYESGRLENKAFIALEYVEGETLKDKLERGLIPVRRAIEIAKEIAEALSKAHDASIVHRDLKPANIVITTGGHVKIMDFGLAKRIPRPGEEKEQTITAMLGPEDSTLGTLAYMSPEQVNAEPVDQRSDIFSFGIVLYEMLTGVHPFRKPGKAETIAAILEHEVAPLSRLLDEVPEPLQNTIHKTLAKKPGQRYQTVDEVRSALEAVSVSLGSPRSLTPTGTLTATAALVASVVLVLSLVYWVGPVVWQSTDQAGFELSAPPRPLTSFPGIEKNPAISPDGKFVAFAWNGGGDGYFHIYVLPMVGGQRLRVTHAEADDVKAVWSPTDNRIAVMRRMQDRREIWMVPFPAGEEKLLHTLSRTGGRGDGLDWSPDGRYLAVDDLLPDGPQRAIYLLDVSTSEKTQLTFPPPQAAQGDLHPVFSPDGSQIAFQRRHLGGFFSLCTQSIREGKPIGKPRQGVRRGGDARGLAYSPDGTELFYPLVGTLFRVAVNGTGIQPISQARFAHSLDVDPTEGCLVYSAFQKDYDIWRRPGPTATESGDAEMLIRSTRNEGKPRYSPDGSLIAFKSDRSGSNNIWWANADGSNQRPLTDREYAVAPRWSPRGDKLAFHSYLGGGASEIFVMGLSDARPTPVTREVADQGQPVWSPDGEWIFYNRKCEGPGLGVTEWQIWKSRSTGGASQRVCSDGFVPFGVDERFVYFFRKPADSAEFSVDSRVWKAPTEGGEASLVLDNQILPLECVLWKGKLVYIDRYHSDGPALRGFDLATRETTRLADLDVETFPPLVALDIGVVQWGGLTVSPDGRWILYGKHTISDADLMVIDASR